jgi:cytochrome P450
MEAPPNAIPLYTWDECVELLRSDVADQGIHLAAYKWPAEEPIWRGRGPFMLDGPGHIRQRRALSTLFRPQARARYREEHLVPQLCADLDALLAAPDEDGVVRSDLVPFAHRFFSTMAVRLTGIEIESAADRDLVLDLLAKILNNSGLGSLPDDEAERRIAQGLAAMEELAARFYRPSLARRQELLRGVEAGTVAAQDVPKDLMTLLARRDDPRWEDEEQAVGTLLTHMLGGAGTTVHPLPWALLELDRWLEHHPADRDRLTDRAFLLGVVAETLRLHPSSPYLFRVARQDITLRSGVEIPEGAVACCMVYHANRDPQAFGENAATFDPCRPASGGMHPYGLAFGMGRHLCIGFPVVTGSQGVDGIEVEVLHALLEAGIRSDPEAAGTLVDHPYRESFVSYPVVFIPGARTRPLAASSVA